MRGYEDYIRNPVPWIEKIPSHWKLIRGKNLYQKMQRPTSDMDEVVTCFRDGTVTLRKNRRITGFTESLKEIGYQGIKKGDLVIHVMDAFAGAIGVSDSDGKGTPVYSVCQAKGGSNNQYYATNIMHSYFEKWREVVLYNLYTEELESAHQIFVLRFLLRSFIPYPLTLNRIRLYIFWTGRFRVSTN